MFSTMPKLRTLELCKTIFLWKTTLILLIPRPLRVALAKSGVGNHDLEIDRDRYAKVPVNESFCKLCLTLNEYQVFLKCLFYGDLRKIYLCFNYDPLDFHIFINIMCTQNQEEIVHLACFVSSMFKLRYCYLHLVWWASPKLNYMWDFVWLAGGRHVVPCTFEKKKNK